MSKALTETRIVPSLVAVRCSDMTIRNFGVVSCVGLELEPRASNLNEPLELDITTLSYFWSSPLLEFVVNCGLCVRYRL